MKENISTNIPKLAASIMFCLFAGLVGSFFTSPAIPGWFATLVKPAFSPPNWIFAPVWTILFVLMGISMYLVWNKGLQNRDVRISLFIFDIQLVLNVLWSFLFFGLRSPFYAFVEIIILWVVIAFTIQNFLKISRTAELLLVPYILWVSFAAILNFYIWNLNS